METRTKNGLTALGLAALSLGALGTSKPRGSSVTDASVTTTTVTATASVAAKPDPTDAPDPTTDYTSLEAAKLDGAKAIGKTVLVRTWRGSTDASSTTLFVCGKGAGGYINAAYTIEKRALVKAIPASIPMQGRCPRVVLKLTGTEAYTKDFKASLEQILDLAPADPETLPPGIDYVSMDDINFDGKKAAGKIALLRAYRGTSDEKKFTAYPCGNSGGLNFLNVTFTAEQKDAVKDLSSSGLACQTIKVKLTTQQPYTTTWNSQLIEIAKD